MLGQTTTEAWVSLLRATFGVTSDGKSAARLPVQVSAGFPFTDLPENANLPNDPNLASISSDGVVRVADRRALSAPEITVHDIGEDMPKKYMDNFVSYFYGRDVKISKEMLSKISRIKNVFVEKTDKSLIVLKEGEHFIFDRERGTITFESEFYPYIPLGTNISYVADLYYETSRGIAEYIDKGVVESGETLGVIHSLEVDANLQIDLWGANTKQVHWLLQRFRELWINEKKLRRDLAMHGLPYNMNLSWHHSGIKTSLDGKFRPYLFNISCKVSFNTEYKVLNLVSDYSDRFSHLDPESMLTAHIAEQIPIDIDGAPIRRYSGSLVVEPYNVGYIIMGGYPKFNIVV